MNSLRTARVAGKRLCHHFFFTLQKIMKEYIDSLKKHVKPIKQIEEACNCCMQYVPMEMFDDSVELVAEFTEDSFQGVSYCLYTFGTKWFMITSRFGTCDGCDEWIGETSKGHQEVIDGIIKDINAVDNLWEIEIDEYVHPSWYKKIVGLMENRGCLSEFNSTIKARKELDQKRDKERERIREEAIAKEKLDKQTKEYEEQDFLEETLYELLAFFEKNNLTVSLESSKFRQLRWCCTQLKPVTDTRSKLKQRAQLILERHEAQVPL
jgi:hypothetical protein